MRNSTILVISSIATAVYLLTPVLLIDDAGTTKASGNTIAKQILVGITTLIVITIVIPIILIRLDMVENGYPNAAHATISDVRTYMEYPKNTTEKPEPGDILIWFRYDCDKCNKIMEQIQTYLSDKRIDANWICSRSEFGKDLREDYPITSVPCIMLILDNGECVTKNLYDTKTNGLSTDNIDRIMALRYAHL